MKRILYSLAAIFVLFMVATVGAQEPSSTAEDQAGTMGQSAQPATPSSSQPASPTEQSATTTDPSATTTTSELPATASPLPLIGLGGLAALGTGVWLSRSRRKR